MKVVIPKLNFNNPINEVKLEEVLALLEIHTDDCIIDIGGGKGTVLAKMLASNNAKGVLLELDEKLIEQCKKQYHTLIRAGRLKVENVDAKAYVDKLVENSVDCFVCIGASYALNGYQQLIEGIKPFLKVGGFLLIGEEFWAQSPSMEYLKILGAKASDSRFHYENIEIPETLGFTYLYSVIASEDDWNRFEGKYFLEEELKAMELSAEEKQKKLEGLRRFRNGQFRYGRKEMGFGLYLFRKNK